MSTEASASPDRGQRVIWIVSLVLCGVVCFLIVGPRPAWVAGFIDVSPLPTVNASLNALTLVLLLAGYAAIRSGRRELHKRLMLSAFVSSSLFLTTYVVYHWFQAGPAKYEGAYRGVYFFVLITHIVLAAVILPFALNTLWRGWTGRIEAHRRIAPGTLWTWLYVSITGVVIYGMLYG